MLPWVLSGIRIQQAIGLKAGSFLLTCSMELEYREVRILS
jgi:hypothetical protein